MRRRVGGPAAPDLVEQAHDGVLLTTGEEEETIEPVGPGGVGRLDRAVLGHLLEDPHEELVGAVAIDSGEDVVPLVARRRRGEVGRAVDDHISCPPGAGEQEVLGVGSSGPAPARGGAQSRPAVASLPAVGVAPAQAVAQPGPAAVVDRLGIGLRHQHPHPNAPPLSLQQGVDRAPGLDVPAHDPNVLAPRRRTDAPEDLAEDRLLLLRRSDGRVVRHAGLGGVPARVCRDLETRSDHGYGDHDYDSPEEHPFPSNVC